MFGICLFLLVSIAILLSIFGGQWNSAQRKGKRGEKTVSLILETLPDCYLTFNDYYFSVDGHSVQIDHIVLSPFGIFVIETKNFKGWIIGAETSEYWIKNYYGNKYKFRNPIKQNLSHVLALKKILGVPQEKIIPIVVFTSKADLKCSVHTPVLYTYQVKKFILSVKDQLFTGDEVSYFAQKLQCVNITDDKRHQRHTIETQNYVLKKETLIQNRICPKCKGQLVERNGKYGSFLGCSNYPRCRFTVPL